MFKTPICCNEDDTNDMYGDDGNDKHLKQLLQRLNNESMEMDSDKGNTLADNANTLNMSYANLKHQQTTLMPQPPEPKRRMFE